MSMLLSVIIPVYNTVAYLRRCVESVTHQTYRQLEIILVDDGSTDGSGDLCDLLANEDCRIKVIHKVNGGTSEARNMGIAIAKGDYIGFLDSDDAWLQENGLELIAQKLQASQSDIILFKPIEIFENGKTSPIKDYDVEFIVSHSAREVFERLVYTEQFGTGTCRQFIKRDIVKDNNILFPVGIKSGEDTHFSCQVWQHANAVDAININMLWVYRRENSNSTGYTIQNLTSYDFLFSYWKKQIANNCVNHQALGALMANLYVSSCYHYFSIPQEDRKQAWQILMLHHNLLTFAASKKSYRMQKLVYRIGIRASIVVFATYGQLKKIYNKIRHPLF